MKLTTKQWERFIDNINTLGLASLAGGVADLVLGGAESGNRVAIDGAGVMLGLIALFFAVRLTSKLNGDKI